MPNVKFVFDGDHQVLSERFYECWEHLVRKWDSEVIRLVLISDRQKLADFYGMCDVFALPSRTDCFALVQVEAMLCGTPVVATNIPGAREVVTVTDMGLLVEPRSEAALAEGLLQVLAEPERYVRPYEHIRGIFDISRTIDAYEALLKRLAV